MATRENEIQDINPQAQMRQFHVLLDTETVTATTTTNAFKTDNMTGCNVWIKATSVAGTPAFTLTVQTSPDLTDANFVTIADPFVVPVFSEVADENAHIYHINLANCHEYVRFGITLGAGDGGDDVFDMKLDYLYGNFTHVTPLDAGDINIGNVDIASMPGSTPTVTNATGAAAIAASTSLSAAFKLVSVTVHFSAAPTTSEALTITLNANDGAAYDTLLFSEDPSATSATDIVFIPDGDLVFESGDEIDVAFTNTDTRTYGVRIVTQAI